MTFSARFKVQDVSEGPSPIDILAIADDVLSNTEGKIQTMELRITLDADETAITEGSVINVSGHFTA